MVDRVTIYEKSEQGDDYGGVKSDWKKLSWNVKCRLYTLGGSVYSINFGGEKYSVIRKMMCDSKINIDEGYKVSDEKNNESFLVIRAYPVKGAKEVSHIQCELARIQ